MDADQHLRMGTAQGRWVIAATVLGSGIAFLDGTVVNVALPAIGRSLHSSLADLQWVVDAYLVTLSALLLLGGSLGDLLGRKRVFLVGVIGFSAASLLCGLAPNTKFLLVARGIQGIAGALLVPGSLAIIAATFHPDDRGVAVGTWSGLTGVSSAIGPFLGGWLIDAVSWRLIFFINLPLSVLVIAIALRHLPETRAPERPPLDIIGGALATVGLALVSYAAINHSSGAALPVGLVGGAALVAFVLRERASSHPMLPLWLFRSRQFSGVNLTTVVVYGALSGALFLVVIRLQVSLGYSALAAGAAMVPMTVIMFALSPTAGRIGQRIGARVPMTVGPLVAAVGLYLFGRISPGTHYSSAVLPAVIVFALGMTTTVAPLTAAVFGSVDDAHTGTASGINNAAARLAGLLAVAVLPALAGITAHGSISAGLDAGYTEALRIAAGLCALGGVIAAVVVRDTRRTQPVPQAAPWQACHDPCVKEPTPAMSVQT